MRLVLASAILGLAAIAATQDDPSREITRGERATLDRLLDRALRGHRTSDPWARWSGHFLKGADGRTYVPFTVTLDTAEHRFDSVTMSVGVAVRELLSARFGGFGLRLVHRSSFAAAMRPAASGGWFARSALMLRPGSYDVVIVVRERTPDGAASAVVKHSLHVPDFTRKGLLLSSVIVVDRVEPAGEGAQAGAARPYVLGASELIPAAGTAFARDETLTVAFQVYNAATFVDGTPDVQVDYRVYRAGENRPIGATAPQTYNVDTLPETFSAAAGHQLTPVQALPLAQFEPGEYRLEIEVRDFLGDARAATDVPFTIR